MHGFKNIKPTKMQSLKRQETFTGIVQTVGREKKHSNVQLQVNKSGDQTA